MKKKLLFIMSAFVFMQASVCPMMQLNDKIFDEEEKTEATKVCEAITNLQWEVLFTAVPSSHRMSLKNEGSFSRNTKSIVIGLDKQFNYMKKEIVPDIDASIFPLLKKLSGGRNCLDLMRDLLRRNIEPTLVRRFVKTLLDIYDPESYKIIKALSKAFKKGDVETFKKLLNKVDNPFWLLNFTSPNAETMLISISNKIRERAKKSKFEDKNSLKMKELLYKIGETNVGYLEYKDLRGYSFYGPSKKEDTLGFNHNRQNIEEILFILNEPSETILKNNDNNEDDLDSVDE